MKIKYVVRSKKKFLDLFLATRKRKKEGPSSLQFLSTVKRQPK